jgi:AraC-like DNA-binding protein/predicted enzyme related to lactoylglutathione lyase
VTSRPAAAQRRCDLAWLRRVRDRIDREYAQPLDVEALARGAHMSAGHFSRQFRLAYGESPYGYLMTRRIERAMALLRRGDLSVTEVCFAVGCASLGTFSSRFTELVGVPPSVYRRHAARATAGMPSCVAKTGDQTDQESRSADPRAAASVTAMDMTFRTSRSSLSQTIPTRPTTSGVTMTGSSTQGIKTVLHPVSDLATAKEVYAALLGVPPQTDESYYVGFEAAGQHIGLVPGGGPQGMTSPVAYWHVPDIEAKLAEVTAAGATVKEPAHDVGGGRLVATVTDPDGNVLGLLQDR